VGGVEAGWKANPQTVALRRLKNSTGDSEALGWVGPRKGKKKTKRGQNSQKKKQYQKIWGLGRGKGPGGGEKRTLLRDVKVEEPGEGVVDAEATPDPRQYFGGERTGKVSESTPGLKRTCRVRETGKKRGTLETNHKTAQKVYKSTRVKRVKQPPKVQRTP